MRVLTMVLVLLLTQSASVPMPAPGLLARPALPITNPPGTLGYYAAQKGLYIGSAITFCYNSGIDDPAYIRTARPTFAC